MRPVFGLTGWLACVALQALLGARTTVAAEPERVKLAGIAASAEVKDAVVAPGSRAAAAYKRDDQGEWLVVWQLPTGQRLFEVGPFVNLGEYEFAADGQMLVAVVEEKEKRRACKRWRIPAGTPLADIVLDDAAFAEAGANLLGDVHLLPGPGRKLFVALAGMMDDAFERAIFWDVGTGARLAKNVVGSKGLRPRDGRFFLVHADAGLELRQPASGKTMAKLKAAPLAGGSVARALASDGSTYAVDGEKEILLWNLRTKRPPKPLRYESLSPGALAVSVGGKLVAAQSAGSRTVMINDGKTQMNKSGVPLFVWRTDTGAKVMEIWGDVIGHWLRFSDDGRYLVWNERAGPQIAMVGGLGEGK